jgi:hypothetical protein
MSSQTTLQILTAARELLSDEARWTKVFLAKSLSGRSCFPRSSLAVCWCSLGAVSREAKRNEDGRCDAVSVLEMVIGGSLSDFNDDPATTHAMILDAFDAAIERARADG